MINLPDEAKLKNIWFLGKNEDNYVDFDVFLLCSSTLAKIRDPFFARSNEKLVCNETM